MRQGLQQQAKAGACLMHGRHAESVHRSAVRSAGSASGPFDKNAAVVLTSVPIIPFFSRPRTMPVVPAVDMPLSLGASRAPRTALALQPVLLIGLLLLAGSRRGDLAIA